MRSKRRITAFVLAVIMSLTVTVQVSAAYGTPMLIESDITDAVSAAEKLRVVTGETDRTARVTKRDLCRLIVRFYRASTGSTGITLSDSRFVDCEDNEVIFCSENGIVNGISDVTFAPDNFVTREEMCRYAVNTLKYCGINIIDSEINYISSFADREDIDPEYAEDINYLTSINVVNSYDEYFYPKSYITYEQVSSILMGMYYQLMLSKIEINGKMILIGDSSEKVILNFGQPAYKFEDKDKAITVWVYNKDLTKLFYIGLKDNRVSEVFSTSTDFSYRGISSGDNFKELNFGSRGTRKNNNVIYSDGYGTVEIGWRPDTGKISYVYSCNNDKNKRHCLSKSTVDGDVSLLYDIVNAERMKAGLNVFKINPQVASSAKLHSISMAYWEYLDYNNRYDLTPFERLQNKGIDYVMASENIACGANLKEIYTAWMDSAGCRSNLFSEYMDYAGIGMAATDSGSSAYVTLDLVQLREYIQ